MKDSYSTKNEAEDESILEGEIMGDDDDEKTKQQILINKFKQQVHGVPAKSALSSKTNSVAGSKIKGCGIESGEGLP